MGPSNAVIILLMVVAASTSPTSNTASDKATPQVAAQQTGGEVLSKTTPAASTAAPAKTNGPGGATQQPHHASPLHKRSGYLEQLFSEPPAAGAEMPYFRDAGDRRRSNARFVRAPVKRSSMRSFLPRIKRESNADDDALALLALWASAANRDDLSLLSSLRDTPYPQNFYNMEVAQPYDNFQLPSQDGAEDPEIIMPEEDEVYPSYNTWSEPDYAVPERFTVMRRSPGGFLPILPSHHKRSPNMDEVASRGRWGSFAPQRKRFMVAKRAPATQGDVYSLAQMLGEQQHDSEPNVPIYRRLML